MVCTRGEGFDKSGICKHEKDKAVETALSVDQKEYYFFFVLVVGCSVLSAPGSSFSKAG